MRVKYVIKARAKFLVQYYFTGILCKGKSERESEAWKGCTDKEIRRVFSHGLPFVVEILEHCIVNKIISLRSFSSVTTSKTNEYSQIFLNEIFLP